METAILAGKGRSEFGLWKTDFQWKRKEIDDQQRDVTEKRSSSTHSHGITSCGWRKRGSGNRNIKFSPGRQY
jgi:hypothetical protein